MGFFLHGCTVIHMQNLALEPIIGHSLLPQTVSYSYWWRARHVGVHKSLFMTSKKCWNIGMTRKLAPVLIRQFLHSYWSRAMAETVVPHHAIRAMRTAFHYKELFTRGPYHFIAGGVLCWKKSLNNYNFCMCFTFLPKNVDVLGRKGIYEWESKCVESVFN